MTKLKSTKVKFALERLEVEKHAHEHCVKN